MQEPHYSQRGFQGFDPIETSRDGDTVQVYESSNALIPSLWLRAEDAVEAIHVTIELSLEAATELRDQLNYLLVNHYQRDQT